MHAGVRVVCLRKRLILLWINFLIQDLKSNEPRLKDINKVADELLFEDLLTPEGSHIRQVITSSLYSSSTPGWTVESSFHIDQSNFIFQRWECKIVWTSFRIGQWQQAKSSSQFYCFRDVVINIKDPGPGALPALDHVCIQMKVRHTQPLYF